LSYVVVVVIIIIIITITVTNFVLATIVIATMIKVYLSSNSAGLLANTKILFPF